MSPHHSIGSDIVNGNSVSVRYNGGGGMRPSGSPEMLEARRRIAARLEDQAKAESRLLRSIGLSGNDLFDDRDTLVEHAYDIQSTRIAYVNVRSGLQGGSGNDGAN